MTTIESGRIYTTKEIMDAPVGIRIIAIGYDFASCHGLEIIGQSEYDIRCVRLDGIHKGEIVNIGKNVERNWILYEDAFIVDGMSPLNAWKDREIFLKDDGIYGYHVQGRLISANENHISLKVYVEEDTNPHWDKDESGRTYYIRMADNRAVDPYFWDLVAEA